MLTAREKDVAKTQIEQDFADFYRDNYPRFASMYDGQATVQGQTLNYLDMVPDRLREEIVRVS